MTSKEKLDKKYEEIYNDIVRIINAQSTSEEMRINATEELKKVLAQQRLKEEYGKVLGWLIYKAKNLSAKISAPFMSGFNGIKEWLRYKMMSDEEKWQLVQDGKYDIWKYCHEKYGTPSPYKKSAPDKEPSKIVAAFVMHSSKLIFFLLLPLISIGFLTQAFGEQYDRPSFGGGVFTVAVFYPLLVMSTGAYILAQLIYLYRAYKIIAIIIWGFPTFMVLGIIGEELAKMVM